MAAGGTHIRVRIGIGRQFLPSPLASHRGFQRPDHGAIGREIARPGTVAVGAIRVGEEACHQRGVFGGPEGIESRGKGSAVKRGLEHTGGDLIVSENVRPILRIGRP